jgi:hypothetical protein
MRYLVQLLSSEQMADLSGHRPPERLITLTRCRFSQDMTLVDMNLPTAAYITLSRKKAHSSLAIHLRIFIV